MKSDMRGLFGRSKHKNVGVRTQEAVRKGLTETLLLVLILPGFGLAQSSMDNWDNLKELALGQQVRVVLNDAKSYEGKFESLTDDAIVVRLNTGDRTFERQRVLRVSTQGKSHRRRHALIGLAVGTGTGIIVGVASPELGQGKCSHGSCVDAGTASMTGAAGAAVGAVVGAVIPTGGWQNLYRATKGSGSSVPVRP